MHYQPLSERIAECVDYRRQIGKVSKPSAPRISLAGILCLGLTALSGCYSMNGYVMNASGHGYYDKGNYAMAAREFQTALASSPTNPDYMGESCQNANEDEETVRAAEQRFIGRLSLLLLRISRRITGWPI